MNRTEPRGNQDGVKIRQLRRDAGLTVAELATRIGVGAPTLSNIELGTRPASLGLMIRIASELGKPLDSLVRAA